MPRYVVFACVSLAVTAAFLGGLAAGVTHEDRVARAASAELPLELFAPGRMVRGPQAAYLIEEVRGGWIRARLYRSIDGHKSPADEPRWIYVLGDPGPWTASEEPGPNAR